MIESNRLGGISIQENLTKELEVAEKIKFEGLDLHQKKHGNGNGEDSRTKPFHGLHHPLALIERGEKISKVLDLPPLQTAFAKIAGAYHDTDIISEKPDRNNLIGRIKRLRGARVGDAHGPEGNEGLSAQAVRKEMKSRGVFTNEEIEIVAFAVEATYPEFEFPKEFSTYEYKDVIRKQNPALAQLVEVLEKMEGIKGGLYIYQPHLEKALEKGPVPYEVLVTALADLGSAGMDPVDSKKFFQEGCAEMRELYYNLLDPDVMGRLITEDSNQDQNDRARVVEKVFFEWLDGQPAFAMWQAMRFEKIIFLLKKNGQLTEEQEKKLRSEDLFGHYIENINGAVTKAKELRENYEKTLAKGKEKGAFIDLADAVGYKVKLAQTEK